MHGLRDLPYAEKKKGRFARNLDFTQEESDDNEKNSGPKFEVNMSHLKTSSAGIEQGLKLFGQSQRWFLTHLVTICI